MRLVKVERAETMMVAGYEFRTLCAPSTDEAVPPSRWARAIAKLRKRQIKNL